MEKDRAIAKETLSDRTQKSITFSFFKDFIYLFFERGEGREKERERNTNVREKHHLDASRMSPEYET